MRRTGCVCRCSGRENKWVEMSWPDALDRIAHEWVRLRDTYGPDALATISSSRGTNEENYLFGKFMRCVVGSNHIDNCARVCHSATVTGMMDTIGASAATNSIQDLDLAKLVLVVGANPTESHPVVGARIKQAVGRGAALIVIDPRRTELARLADLHLQLHPGTNVALLNGLGHILIQEGLIDQDYVRDRTQGFEEWVKVVESLHAGDHVEGDRRPGSSDCRSGASVCHKRRLDGRAWLGHDRTSLG
jgi:formate dehydrogenase major subunit